MEEGCMVSILLLEEEYIYRKDALDLKPKEWFNQTELQTKECSKRSEKPRRLTVSKH